MDLRAFRFNMKLFHSFIINFNSFNHNCQKQNKWQLQSQRKQAKGQSPKAYYEPSFSTSLDTDLVVNVEPADKEIPLLFRGLLSSAMAAKTNKRLGPINLRFYLQLTLIQVIHSVQTTFYNPTSGVHLD